ncbi:MAG TPA: flagellar motor switch protein FliN [Persephonella sp.]|uniref:Flagellar motor switch protein FliN n=1 Tax=Persephonella marina (strain DSM 14350 / EX-H1) TaxID=123214 RepID=C0QPA3_PERMH|nr:MULTISPECIES: FliM/FliN family flagellar motor switch protein [Persephonella]ACO04499.1 flagellar motor switch phosphatase FliY [Persephonella marina EX-H1]HCB69886.1 flagellar motor switch protein FliN [Persephonella sp.]
MSQEHDISFLKDVTVKVTGEVGRVKKLFIEIITLKEGDIIKLDKHIEDYVELYVKDQLFAVGELIVANEKYGIRVVDLA